MVGGGPRCHIMGCGCDQDSKIHGFSWKNMSFCVRDAVGYIVKSNISMLVETIY